MAAPRRRDPARHPLRRGQADGSASARNAAAQNASSPAMLTIRTTSPSGTENTTPITSSTPAVASSRCPRRRRARRRRPRAAPPRRRPRRRAGRAAAGRTEEQGGRQDHDPDRRRDDQRDQRRAARGRLLHVRPGRMSGRWANAQPASTRGDAPAPATARRLVAAAAQEDERGQAGDRRDDDRRQARAVGEAVQSACASCAHDDQPRHAPAPRPPRRDERAPAELLDRSGSREPHRVGGQVDRGQVDAVPTARTPTAIDVGFQPAREQVAGGVADRHPARGDPADHRAERERREHRGDREQAADQPLLARASRSGSQRVGRAAHDDPDRRDEQRHGERRGDRAEGRRVGRPGDHEHEDQPDVVRLPHRPHRVQRVLADAPAALRPRRQRGPEPGAEVGDGEHGVGHQADQDQDDGTSASDTGASAGRARRSRGAPARAARVPAGAAPRPRRPPSAR